MSSMIPKFKPYTESKVICRYAVLNDIHFPYQSEAYDAAIQIIRKWENLKGIYLNGDIAEIESVSSHPKTPKARQNLLEELEYTRARLDDLGKYFPGLPVTYICGNHEFRVFRYIRDVAPELWGLIHCPDLLGFPKRKNWKFIDYGPDQWVKCGVTKDLWLRHEPIVGGAFHAKGTAERSYVSVMYGHTHVSQQFTTKKLGPKPYMVTAVSNGWLGDITKDCFDYRGSRDAWQLGFSMVECEERSGVYEIRFIRF